MSEPVSIRAAEIPDAPLLLSNVEAVTTAYQVGLSWDEGTYNGGSPVIDYRVSFTDATDYTIFQDGITATQVTVTGLTPGVTYSFKAEARNLVGYSAYSDVLQVLAAQIPDAPTDLVTVPAVTTANQIGLSWVAPAFNGGSSVLDYAVWYDDATNGVTFTEFASGLTDLSYTAAGLVQGSTYKFKV